MVAGRLEAWCRTEPLEYGPLASLGRQAACTGRSATCGRGSLTLHRSCCTPCPRATWHGEHRSALWWSPRVGWGRKKLWSAPEGACRGYHRQHGPLVRLCGCATKPDGVWVGGLSFRVPERGQCAAQRCRGGAPCLFVEGSELLRDVVVCGRKTAHPRLRAFASRDMREDTRCFGDAYKLTRRRPA